ncbi:serpin family protein [uncultured Vagococcus sp.]|uniref:serpin family protein n=1 Tax=uncultured Vagococcus sp. TaxID=189676 RepID=UPI0028D0537B|nr:serpin family protein [uncultured Vagococcus sp.]
MKKKLMIMGLSLMSFLLVSCGEPGKQVILSEGTKEKTYSSISGADSFNQFAATSGSIILQEVGNPLYGPIGPFQLLGLLSEGAAGKSKEDIYGVLFTNSEEYPSLKVFNQELLGVYQDKEVASLANSIWVDQEFNVRPAFEKVAKETYSASVNTVPFAKSPRKAAKKVTDWVEKQLGTDLFDQKEVTEETRLVLLNTVRLHLAWIDKFETSQTDKQLFYGEQDLRTDFMHQQQENHPYAHGVNFVASSLALENDHQLLFILPDEDVPVNQLIEAPEKLHELINLEETEIADVNFAIPKFELTTDIDLIEVMKQLGLTSIFDNTKADLSQLIDSEPLVINSFKQTNQLKIDEEKVKVESVTSMGAATAAARPMETKQLDLTLYLYYSGEGQITIVYGRN